MKISKTICYFILIIALLLYIGFILMLLTPFDLDHAVYMCQSALKGLPHILSYIVYTIISLFIAKIIIDYLSIYKNVSKLDRLSLPNNLFKLLTKHNLINKVVLYKKDEPEAFCAGLLQPKIYISSKMLSIMEEKEVESILLHEMYHVKNKNNLVLFTLNIFSFFLFAFPFIKDLSKKYELTAELEADKMAVSYLKRNQYIIKALKKLILYKPSYINYGLGFSKLQAVEYRVKFLVNEELPSATFSLRNISISFFSFVILTLLLLLPISKTHIHAEGKDYMLYCYYSNNCQNVCTNETELSHHYNPLGFFFE